MALKSTILFFSIFIFTVNIAFSQNYYFLDSLKKCKHKKIENENMSLKMKRMDQCYVGMKLPDLKGISISGDTIDSGTLQGKIVVINIWSLWCGPCIAELPGLNDLTELYKDKNLVFIALAKEKKETILNFLENKHPFKFKIIPDAKNIYYRQLDSFGFPRTIIVDQKGIIRKVFSGGVNSRQAPELIKQEIIPEVEKLLNDN